MKKLSKRKRKALKISGNKDNKKRGKEKREKRVVGVAKPCIASININAEEMKNIDASRIDSFIGQQIFYPEEEEAESEDIRFHLADIRRRIGLMGKD